MTKIGDLRAAVFDRDNHTCCWPGCLNAATELMHFRSRGMGGSKYRDTMGNTGAACDMHARFSDGELAGYGCDAYRKAHLDLLGARFLEMPAHFVAYERAEELTRRAKLAAQEESL